MNLPRESYRSRSQAGMSLIETVIALAILLIIAAGIMTVATVSITTTENQGNLSARTAEYAQDKLEQLISLNYADGATDTTAFPACNPASTTPPPCTTGTGLTIGGTAVPTPVIPAAGSNGWMDYLDASGNPMALGAGGATPVGWFYIRAWQISQFSVNVKQITVTCKVSSVVGNGTGSSLSQSTVTTLKTNPF